jgi:hypothetical protein
MVELIEHGQNRSTLVRMPSEQKKDKIRSTGRNFNEEWMVKLWQEYHGKTKKVYELLYYDKK